MLHGKKIQQMEKKIKGDLVPRSLQELIEIKLSTHPLTPQEMGFEENLRSEEEEDLSDPKEEEISENESVSGPEEAEAEEEKKENEDSPEQADPEVAREETKHEEERINLEEETPELRQEITPSTISAPMFSEIPIAPTGSFLPPTVPSVNTLAVSYPPLCMPYYSMYPYPYSYAQLPIYTMPQAPAFPLTMGSSLGSPFRMPMDFPIMRNNLLSSTLLPTTPVESPSTRTSIRPFGIYGQSAPQTPQGTQEIIQEQSSRPHSLPTSRNDAPLLQLTPQKRQISLRVIPDPITPFPVSQPKKKESKSKEEEKQ